MSKRKKRLEKKIASLDERIAEHERKKAEYKGKEMYIRPYWDSEIEEFKTEKEKAIRLMGRKKKTSSKGIVNLCVAPQAASIKNEHNSTI